MENFKLQENSLEVFQTIVKNFPKIKSVKIISHKVEINWRQLHKEPKEKINNIAEAIEHPKLIKEKIYERENFLNLTLQNLEHLSNNEVWSLTSKVLCDDGTDKHIPMMNFHPIDISLEEIKQAIKIICGENNGIILSSGRFFHYYGNFLLTEKEWEKFMIDFLMPCVLVSPRYVGHRLNNGYCTLRLTADKEYKTTIPKVIDLV